MFSCSQWQILEKGSGVSCCQHKVCNVFFCYVLEQLLEHRKNILDVGTGQLLSCQPIAVHRQDVNVGMTQELMDDLNNSSLYNSDV